MQDERQMKNQENSENQRNQGNLESQKNQDGQGEEEQFAFLQEKIKPEKKKQGRMVTKILSAAVLGMVFGGFACASFYALTPVVENAFRGEREPVTIPVDEEPTEEEAQPEVTLPETPVLTVDDYLDMMKGLYSVAREAEKSLVVVHFFGGEDWMLADRQGAWTATGMIAADSGWEILIVTDDRVCADGVEEESRQWSVTFYDGSRCPATLKTRDKNRGLAVFSVNGMALSESTKNNIHAVVWGNSNIASRGEVVIALGNMFGYDNGIGYGIISSKKYDTVFADASCGVLATDIAMSAEGDGVLVNQKGEVLGLIRGDVWANASDGTAKALAISDLKPVLEMLLNGESVPYIGIRGMAVTENISAEQGLPHGVYVTDVAEDSPAMRAGIQNGDIIQKVGNTDVTGISSYEKAVLKCKAGAQVKVKARRRGNGGYVDVEFMVTVGSLE